MYNEKKFLAPNSINSMSAIHCKHYDEDDRAIVRIGDCHNTMRIWNHLYDGKEDMLIKIDTLIDELTKFRNYIKDK